MAFYGQNRMVQMQEEMERFEQEIANQLGRPPLPRMTGPNMSLRFIPHQLASRPVTYAPPSSTAFPQGISTAAVAAAAMATAANAAPQRFTTPTQPASAVIEAAPTKYTTPTAGKKGVDARQAGSTALAGNTSAASASSASSTAKPTHSETSQSKSADKSSNSTLAYTVVGGSKPSTSSGSQGPKKYKRYVRAGGGQVWTDPSLNDWDPNDFRIFCGDLGNEVSDELLAKAFRKFPSFQKAKVVRDKRSNKTKGYGFVSFKDPDDFTRALREMDGKYVGNRPIKLRKSEWKDRNMGVVKKKTKAKKKLGMKF